MNRNSSIFFESRGVFSYPIVFLRSNFFPSRVNKKEPKPGGLILLLNGNQVLLSKKEFDNSKVTNELVQLNLTFPVFIIRVRLFTGDVGWQLANFIQDNDTRGDV